MKDDGKTFQRRAPDKSSSQWPDFPDEDDETDDADLEALTAPTKK
mgnify:CR=1 FL=1